MNSKQRVIAAVDHREPDRVPLAYGATPETTEALQKYLGVANEEELLRALRIDFRNVNPVPKIPTCGDFFGDPLVEDLGGSCFKDIWGITFKRVEYGLGSYIEYESSPLEHVVNVSELRDYSWPDVHQIWDFGNIRQEAEERNDYAVVYDGAVLFQFCQALRGLEPLLVDLANNPIIAETILEKVVNYWIEFGTSLLKEANGSVDFFVINDDYGMQQGPLFNPTTWRRHIKPMIWEVIKAYKRYGVKIIFHSCGSVRAFIPDLIEMGADVLDPIQVSARGMDPQLLKKDYGDRLCFRGAIDTQRVLPLGTSEEVEVEVRKRIRELGPGGGYIATSVHNLQPDVPLHNILTMFQTAWDYGNYPLLPA
jgi:uroporphyrinogen decarboxylase